MAASARADEEGRKVFLGGLSFDAREEQSTLARQLEEGRAALSACEQQLGALGASHRELEQVAAAHAQLQAQAQARWAQVQQGLAQQGQAQYVPLGQVRELQVEMAQLEQRHGLLRQQHAGLQQLLRHRETELQQSGTHARRMQQQLQLQQVRQPSPAGGGDAAVQPPGGGGGAPVSASAAGLWNSMRSGVQGLLQDFTSTVGASSEDASDKEAPRTRE